MKNKDVSRGESRGKQNEVTRLGKFIRFQMELWRFCGRRLLTHNAMEMSAALSFRTIFALIPALALMVLILRGFGVLEDSKQSLRDVLGKVGVSEIVLVPEKQIEEGQSELSDDRDSVTWAKEGGAETETEEEIQAINAADKIVEFVEQLEKKLTIGTIGPVGILLLIYTALALMMTIEQSLNRIYEARHPRGWRRRLMMYWTVLTLGPLIMTVVQYVSRNIHQRFSDVQQLAWIFELVRVGSTFITAVILLAFVYKIIPNTRVKFVAAIGGAVIAVPVWMVFRYLFGLYVTRIVGGGSFYGALGLLPLFLFWVNVSWLIFLFGAELSHTATSLKKLQAEELAHRITLRPTDLLATALVVARAFVKGKGAIGFEGIGQEVNLPGESIQTLLDRLESLGIVAVINGEREGQSKYGLARPADKIGVLEAMDIESTREADIEIAEETGCEEVLRRVKERLAVSAGDMTLAELVEDT